MSTLPTLPGRHRLMAGASLGLAACLAGGCHKAVTGPAATGPGAARSSGGLELAGRVDVRAPPSIPAAVPVNIVVQVILAPPARIAADGNSLGHSLPVPLGDLLVDGLLKTANSKGLPLGPPLFAAAAPDRPLALVLAKVGSQGPLGFCVAVPLAPGRDAASLSAMLDPILGPQLAERRGAVLRRGRAGQTYWSGISDGTLLLGRSYADVWVAGLAALAASRAPMPAEDAVAILRPDEVMGAAGITWKQLALTMREGAAGAGRKRARGGHAPARAPRAAPTAAARASTERLADAMAMAFSRLTEVRVTARASTADGLVAGVVLTPRPQALPTPVEAPVAAGSPPYALDPTLPVRDERTGVAAWGSLGMLDALLRALLPVKVGGGEGPGGEGRRPDAGVSPVDEFLSAFTGGGSCTFEFADSPPSSVCSMPLRPGVDRHQALDRYAALVRATVEWEAAEGVTPGPQVTVRGGVLEYERPIDTRRLTPEQQAMARSYLGAESTKYAAAVRGDRLLQFQGADPAARLATWKDPPASSGAAPPRLPPLLEAELVRARGSAAVVVFDPLLLMLQVIAHSADALGKQHALMLAALPGLARTRVPMVWRAQGGPGYGYELRIPSVSFDNVAALLRPYMGTMGRAPASDSKPP